MNNPSIGRHCPKCRHYHQVEITLRDQPFPLVCPQCQAKWGDVQTLEAVFECCPVCAGRQFYTSKDFNQFVGCLIMGIGIVLVPWTYGLSLLVFALIDFFLHKRVPTIINCYKCGTEFRNFKTDKPFKPFMHHIGLKYDKYR